ncbi:heat shock protein 70 putative [Entamoeba histolytica]|uniref:Heat shock protein 70, putative n=2 Tax=Entamoeba histolytica TaxID=5759 RepID=C4MAT4_ENTH1|nr:heat shock protein 70, putative [Entamoeba histolytica HM-1:IMSS]EAL43092.1 heat shock protein 70, putative [Entamoeba histolytica HM-1:IMSS]GAT98952.1 heat shock protein 70 putative [Entamoeba histolytica]|eukprot:XP_648477.1 heat shock protein 70, putative [Entamoeba histolytica HM-1:IMSS]
MTVEQNSFSIGIDLGIMYSSIAYFDINKGESVIVQDELGKEQVASWVSLSQLDKSGYTIIGDGAKNDINSKCVIYDSKRIIGRDECDVNYEHRDNYPFEVKCRDNGSAYIECYNPKTQGIEEFEPEEISGMILKYMYDIAQASLKNSQITNVIVTVPVDFNDRQRDATLLACKLAEIKNVELVNEPTAAIVEYKREYPNSLKDGDRVVVIDFGGTLDVACCRIINDNNIRVESSGGDQDLGGNDFDNVMIDIIKKRVEDGVEGYYEKKRGMTQKEKITLNKKLVILKKEAERIKIELSGKQDAELYLEIFFGGEDYDGYGIDPNITRQEFEEECEKRGLYERFINKIKQVTQRKRYKKGNVQLVLFVGGTSKMPRIKQEVGKLFDIKTFADYNFNPLTAVAKGAAYLAYLKKENAASTTIVYDIVPTPIGIEVEGGMFQKLIKDGEVLPTNGITKRICTIQDNQKSIELNTYKGFGKYVNSPEMEYIATLHIDGIPSGKAGEQIIEFTIQINQNGMMKLSGSVVGSDVKRELSVDVDLSKIEEGEILKLIKHFQNFIK